RAHHLRLAAQAVRILHARIVLQMRAADLTILEKREIVLGDVPLPGMAAQFVDPIIERRVAPRGRVDRQCAGRNCAGEYILAGKETCEREGRRDLRAIEQRQALLWRELERLRVLDLADAEEGEREMGERRKIARGADRTF